MAQFINDAIFWVEIDKIKPNPFQPRREFDEAKLNDLARSIRQYGVLQPLTVTRKEFEKDDGGIATEYELIAGERRLRAARKAQCLWVDFPVRRPDHRVRLPGRALLPVPLSRAASAGPGSLLRRRRSSRRAAGDRRHDSGRRNTEAAYGQRSAARRQAFAV